MSPVYPEKNKKKNMIYIHIFREHLVFRHSHQLITCRLTKSLFRIPYFLLFLSSEAKEGDGRSGAEFPASCFACHRR
jgi:hypothetical protein